MTRRKYRYLKIKIDDEYGDEYDEDYGYVGALRYCDNVGQFCEAPPDGGTRTRATCFGCGMPACKACSLRVQYYNYGRKRICHRCLEERLDKHGELLVTKHILRLAGYGKESGEYKRLVGVIKDTGKDTGKNTNGVRR